MKVINSDDRLSQWLFIHDNNSKREWSSEKELPVTLPGLPELKSAMIASIEEATSYIKICSFIITDRDIIDCLIKRLAKHDIAVFILTQLDDSKFSTSFLTDEEILENRSQVHLDTIAILSDGGAHIRAAESVHAKFMIVDGEYTILTSANLTTPSLNENPETGVILKEGCSLTAERLFDTVYRYGTTYRKFVKAGNDKRFVLQNESELNSNWTPLTEERFLFTLSDLSGSIYQALLDLIDEAKTEITLASYCIVGLKNLPEFLKSIQEAIERGVRIRIFCRGMNYRSDHLMGCSVLAQLGCEIYGDLLNHSKGCSNEQKTVIFTANIDGRHGLKGGFEVGAYLSEQQGMALQKFMNWQIENSCYGFEQNPVRDKYFSTYEWYCKTRGINCPPRFDNLIVGVENLSKGQIEALETKAFYGVYENGTLIALDADDQFLTAQSEGNKLLLKATNTNYFNKEKYLIRYDKMTLHYG